MSPMKIILLLLILYYPLTFADIHAREVARVRKFCKNRRIEYNLHLDVRPKISEVDVGISLLAEICYNQKRNKLCHRNIDNLKSDYSKFKNKWEIIELNDITKGMRKKRYVENDLLQSNNITAKILKRAMDLADQGYADLRTRIEDIQKETVFLMDSQNKLGEYVGYINFHSIAQITFETLHQITSITDSVLRLVVDGDTTSLMNLIDLNNLGAQMRKMDHEALKSNCTIPAGRNSFELVKYLKFCSFDVRILGDVVVISIIAPSVSTEVFTLLEPVSIPFSVKGSTYKEKPLHDNILVHENGFHLRTYVPLSDRERSSCRELPEGKLICYPSEPVLTETVFSIGDFDELFSSDSIDCATVMMDKNIKETRCPLIEIPHRNMLIRFERDIYTVYIVETAKITIDCPDKSMELIFNDTRSLPVPKSCSVYMDNLLLVEKTETPAYDVIYLSNNTSSIRITENDLLNMKQLETVNLTKEFRNLNPDFDEINHEIDNQIYTLAGFLSRWRLKDEVLLAIIIALTLSIIFNWLTTCYYIRKIRRQQSVYYMEARTELPVSMKPMSPMRTFTNRMQSIERNFIKPFSPPRSDSLMLNMYDRQFSLPDQLSFPSYPNPTFELKAPGRKPVETTVNFNVETGQIQTVEISPPPPTLLDNEENEE